MHRRYATYSDLTAARRRRPFLRTAQLDAVGLGVLAGACLVAAVACALGVRRTGWPLPARAALGPVAVVSALVVLDRRKWSGTVVGFSFTDDLAATRTVADALIAQGLPVVLEERPPGRPALRYAQRNARRVHVALEGTGVDTPLF